MASGLETRKRLRLDGSGAEPKRKGAIAGVFKQDIFLKKEDSYSGVEVDTRQAAALEQCLHSDASLCAASSLLQTSILGTGELELARGPDGELVQPTPLFGVFLRTWFQPLAAELCSDMVVFGYAVTAIESKKGAINVPVRLHPLLCTVKVSTKNCRVSLIASGDFDDTITNPTVHTMFAPGIDGTIRSPAASSMDMCSLLSTFSSVAAEAARERADPIVLIQARHGPTQASQSSVLRNMLWDSESREQMIGERESAAFQDDDLMHRLVNALNHAQTTHRDPREAKKDESTRGHRVARTQVIPRDSEAANSAPKVETDGIDAIMSAREKAHKLYMASFGFTDSVLNASNGRTGESTHAIKLFEARIGTLRSRLEVALTMVLQQLFPEYAMTDTRLQMKRPKELQQDGLGQVLSAHQAGLLPQAEAAALVHHQLGGVCHPQDEGDEKDEQPAEVAAAAGEDARSEAESSRSSKSVTSLVSSGS